MSCDDSTGDCAQSTAPAPDPVMPRCDIVLPDGVYTNASVTVEDGCITAVASGVAPQYTPDPCCASTSGGGSDGGGVKGDKGDPGAAGTIAIGTVTTLAPGSSATVVNVGTPSAAILNIGLPRGDAGQDASNINGVTSDAGGITIETGLVKLLPASWPPVLEVVGSSNQTGVTFQITKNADNGIVTMVLDMSVFSASVTNQINQAITTLQNNLQSQINSMQTQIGSLQTQIATLQTQIANCCGGAG